MFSKKELFKFTTIKVGGFAYISFPSSKYEFLDIIDNLVFKNKKFFILGNGSNILLSPECRNYYFISTKRMNKIFIEDNLVIVESGVLLPYLIYKLNKYNLFGLQKLAGIPASIGGAIFMNAGSYGQNISDYLNEVEVFDLKSKKIYTILAKNLKFYYRSSSIKEDNLVILKAKFKFEDNYNSEFLKNLTKDTFLKKSETQPLNFPSFGSVFKNPPKYKAWQLIDKVGLRGIKKGGAEISKKHTNFILNKGNASYDDIIYLVNLAYQKVFTKFKIKLEREFVLI